MLSDIGLVENIDKTLAVLAIGAGSAVVIHANDSFFWVISRTSHMDVKDGYRYLSLGSFVFGVVGFLVIMGVSVVA